MDPREIQFLNQRQPVRYNPGAVFNSNLPAKSGYEVYLAGYADSVVQGIESYADKMAINRALTSLVSNPRPINEGFQKTGAVDVRAFKTGEISTNRYKIEYRILSGQVLVYNIEMLDKFQEAMNRAEKAGLYHIRKSKEGFWKIDSKPNTVPAVETKYAAVNGMLNNRLKAAWLMGRHLEAQYGRGENITEYTLFHNPSGGFLADGWESVRDKFGFTTDVAKKLSHVLQDVQQRGKPVNWVVHSQGALIFMEAVRYHLNGNSSWAIFGGFNGAFGKNEGKSLDMHTVAFHGSANNKLRSSVLLERANIQVQGYLAHPYDFVHQIIGLNTLSPKKLVGSAVYADHVIFGSTEQSPHTLPFKGMANWNRQMEQGPGKGRNALQRTFEEVASSGRNRLR